MLDEKGRLFGKLNIIDLLVLILLIAVVVILAVQLFGGGEPSTDAEETPAPTPTATPKPTPGIGTSLMEFTVRYGAMDPEMYGEIKKHIDAGDVQTIIYDGTEAKDAVIVGIEAEPRTLTMTSDDGSIKQFADPLYLDVTFTLRAVTENAEANSFWAQEVRIGRGFMVKTRHTEVWGTVMDCKVLEYYPPKAPEEKK